MEKGSSIQEGIYHSWMIPKKEEIFIGPQISELLKNQNFKHIPIATWKQLEKPLKVLLKYFRQ